MHDQVVELAEQGKALAREDRSRLVDILLVSLHEDPFGEIEAAWDDKIERRCVAYDRGRIQAIRGEEVLAKAHALVRQ